MMRSFDERIAEINRRSGALLKKRKKRRIQILMACIPLVLCIALILPGHLSTAPENEIVPEAAAGQDTTEIANTLLCSVMKIEVSGFGFSQSYTDSARIFQIYDHLQSYDLRPIENNSVAMEDAATESKQELLGDDYCSISDTVAIEYTITLVMHDGVKTQYCFDNTGLKNLTTNESTFLTREQAKELTNILGLPSL